MATRLVKKHDREPPTFEVFELELDEGSWPEFVEDPERFLRDVLAREERVVNGIAIDDNVRQVNLADTKPPKVMVLHCVEPPEGASHYITITRPE